MKLQKTIKSEAKISGKGLFGSKEAKVVFRPASADSGVVFVRTDVPEPVRIGAVVPNLAERSRRTTIRKGSVSVETVEHCLAAVSALGIDNLIIEVNGLELPARTAAVLSISRLSNGLVWLSSRPGGESLLSVSRLVLPPVMHRYTRCHMRMTD